MPTRKIVECRTPTPGKKPTNIDADLYALFKKAMLAELRKEPDGVALKPLVQRMKKRLAAHAFNAKGSVSWYTTTVKLDLEVRGFLERVSGARPQRVRLTAKGRRAAAR